MSFVTRMAILILILMVLEELLCRFVLMRRLSYRRYFNVNTAFAGESVKLVESVRNSKWIPVPLLVVESRLPDAFRVVSADQLEVHDDYHKSLFTLMPATGLKRTHTVQLLKRGRFVLDHVTVTASGLLGFSRSLTDEWPVESQLTVYPRLLEDDETAWPCHSWSGDRIVKRWILDDPMRPAGIRDYMPGDPLKRVNWAATARTGALLVNRYEFTASARLLLLLNIESPDTHWGTVLPEEPLEQAISLAATLAHRAVQDGLEVGFVCNGTHAGGEWVEVPVGAGEPNLFAIWEQMACLTAKVLVSGHTLLERLSQSGLQDTDIVFLTAHVDGTVEPLVRILQAQGNAVEVVLLGTGVTPDDE